MARKKSLAAEPPPPPAQVIVERVALRDALATLKPLCSGKGSPPILESALAEAGGGELWLRATDLDLTLSLTIPLLEPEGELPTFLFPLDRVLAFVKSSWDESVVLSLDEQGLAVKAGARAVFKLIYDASDYPELPLRLLTGTPTAVFTRLAWEAIKAASAFTDPKSRHGFDRVYLFGNKGPEPRDGEHLGVIDVYGVKGISGFRRCGLPAGDIADFSEQIEPRVVHLLAGLDWTTCTMHSGLHHLLFEGADFQLAQRKLEGIFNPTSFWSAGDLRETSIVSLLPGIEAVAGLQEGSGSVLGIDPTEDGARVFVEQDAASGSADLGAYFPSYRCNYGDELLRVLRAVDGHGAVRVGEVRRMQGGSEETIALQFEAEDGTGALVSHIWRKD